MDNGSLTTIRIPEKDRVRLSSIQEQLKELVGHNVSICSIVHYMVQTSASNIEDLLRAYPPKTPKKLGRPPAEKPEVPKMVIKTPADAAYSNGAKEAMRHYAGKKKVLFKDIVVWWKDSFSFPPNSMKVAQWLKHYGAQKRVTQDGNYWVFPSDIDDDSTSPPTPDEIDELFGDDDAVFPEDEKE